jgi:hypothetical protein
MNKHLTDGELRAALDGELLAARAQHLDDCASCQARQAQIQAQSQRTAQKLTFLALTTEDPIPSARLAWGRFSQQLLLKKETSMFKRWFAYPVVRVGVIAALLLALVLAIPSTRALAGQLLNLFRVQQVTVIPVDFTGVEQLTGNDALGSQFSALISSSVDMKQKPGDPQAVTDANQASQMTGFNVRIPGG